jgi:hypothetical protein
MTPQPLNYVSRPIVEGISQLEKEPDGVVITDPILPYDVLVPVFARHPSFTGHPVHTLYSDVKERLREEFFAGTWSEVQAHQFLANHRIVYVIAGPEGYIAYPTSLSEIFRNETLIIYKATVQ